MLMWRKKIDTGGELHRGKHKMGRMDLKSTSLTPICVQNQTDKARAFFTHNEP
jgi:hypothetical protein